MMKRLITRQFTLRFDQRFLSRALVRATLKKFFIKYSLFDVESILLQRTIFGFGKIRDSE